MADIDAKFQDCTRATAELVFLYKAEIPLSHGILFLACQH
jgi:hypothetical protein